MSWEMKERPLVTVDIIIFTIKDDALQVLLVKRKVEPEFGKWSLPGGQVNIRESLEDAAKRELEEETGVKNVYLEQLYSFGDPYRDKRGRVVTIAYYALVRNEHLKLKAGTDAAEAKLFPAQKYPKLAFDHTDIVEYAIKRLKWKLEYTTVAFELLPKKFTLTQLQRIYEIVLARKLDKRNFRKKIFSLGVVKETGESTKGGAHRPAKLYKCTKKSTQILEII